MTIQPTGGRVHEFGLPDRIRVAREQARLTQAELADLTGISLKSVSRYETGETRPRRLQLGAIALATGFSLEWLETGAPPTDPDGGGGGNVRREGIEPPTRWFDVPPGQSLFSGLVAA